MDFVGLFGLRFVVGIFCFAFGGLWCVWVFHVALCFSFLGGVCFGLLWMMWVTYCFLDLGCEC